MAEGRFREDLYYRLAVVTVELPPLRERREDLPELIEYFIGRYNREYGRRVTGVSPAVLAAFAEYSWPGNIRQLASVMERAVLLSRGETIQIHHLPEEFQSLTGVSAGTLSLEEMERRHIISVLRLAKDKEEAAEMLGIDPATLWRKRKKYGL